MNNAELAMRLTSKEIRSGETFFTDLNGFAMIKRKRMSKIPLQANYYPVASMMYIQDDDRSVSIWKVHLSCATGGARACLSSYLEAALKRADLANWFDQLRTGFDGFLFVSRCCT